ncbi:Tm-1-like ATP-binding domain-containing protein [Actinotalea sp.]|uniref:Tm-1-like ATP-binding domain-containing protein n=1 Tax=Actinotalea sp. TaxID=1872145 RepID=UPI003569DED3
MARVVLLGTFDTKGEEYAWLRDRLREEGCETLLIDAGVFSDGNGIADILPAEVAAAGGADLEELRAARDRGASMGVMARGGAALVKRLVDEGTVHGFLAIGGSGGSSVAAQAMQAMPVGTPKVLVSTMAAGDVSPYVGVADVTLMYSVVDVAGINSISRRVFGNAVAAIAGMAQHYEASASEPAADEKPLIGATMFGVTTPAVTEARERLEELGYEVLVFHATGAGGKAMEALAEAGFLAGILDLTTTELADDLVGGVLSAGPHRLEAAGRVGLPHVVSVGALDMVNFGPEDTVPAKFADRLTYVHNPTVTLMRTTREEMAQLGRSIATKVSAATGPVAVLLPTRGVSAIDVDGAPFRDAEADAALFAEIHGGLDGTAVPVTDVDCAINDAGFGRQMADTLHSLITSTSTTGKD